MPRKKNSTAGAVRDELKALGTDHAGEGGRRTGRPSTFTQAIADELCDNLMRGLSLREVCRMDGMPAQSTVFGWLGGKGGVSSAFSEQYAQARRVGAEVHIDLILQIADDATNDWMEREAANGNEKAARSLENGEAINRSRLRIETRKWIASKLVPKVYGDKQQLEVTHKYDEMDDDALNAEIEAALAARAAAPARPH